jgi:hypothetical protein
MVEVNIKTEKRLFKYLEVNYMPLKNKEEQKKDEKRDFLKLDQEIEVKKSELIIFHKTELLIIE